MAVSFLDSNIRKKVALLATGDELTQGDILNTNTQKLAQRLFENNINIGLHIITSDNQHEIREAIIYLLKNHDGLILTGGLGPTSDDRTRYALSAALKKPLIFDMLSWDRIVERITQISARTPPESNKQQALFPKDAVILENENGTAAGCYLYLQGKSIFMLPGPPNECLPMFEKFVLNKLIEARFQQAMYHKKWLLFGVSEGVIAAELDALVKPFQVSTGFRIAYPYVEFKLHSEDELHFQQAINVLKPYLSKYILADGERPISALLENCLEHLNTVIDIHDFATGGRLESQLRTPSTTAQVVFHNQIESNDHLHVTINGLNEYWQQNFTSKNTTLLLTFTQNGVERPVAHSIPCYSPKVIHYAVEIICFEIFNALQLMR